MEVSWVGHDVRTPVPPSSPVLGGEVSDDGSEVGL